MAHPDSNPRAIRTSTMPMANTVGSAGRNGTVLAISDAAGLTSASLSAPKPEKDPPEHHPEHHDAVAAQELNEPVVERVARRRGLGLV